MRKYLTQTLEGVVSQKTNFNFELIIHDDAQQMAVTKLF